MAGRKKDPNKMTQTFQIMVDDELKAKLLRAKEKGVNFQPVLRDAMHRIIDAYEKGNLFNY